MAADPSALESHCSLVAELLAGGDVIPFLGAGANLCDRPDALAWEHGKFPPSGNELAQALAERSHYPSDRDSELPRVSQYIDAKLGARRLYRYIHAVFDVDYPPSSLHRMLARVPAVLRAAGMPQLVVLTTNYDDLVERALRDAGEAVDVDLVRGEARPGSGSLPAPAAGRRGGAD